MQEDNLNSQFNNAVSTLIGNRLKKFTDKTLDVPTCVEIYQTIFDTLVETFDQANAGITNEAMNWLSQAYYDCVLINDTQELDPNIFTQRAKIENIETKELALLAMMLNGTHMCVPLIHEIKKRS
jgi:hypothetical protein